MSDWVLVTGAAQGLGEEIAYFLAKQGHNIVIHTRETDPTRAANRCRECQVEVETLFGDFSTPRGVENFLESYLRSFSDTKGIVNNVGNFATGRPSHISGDLMQSNFFAPVAITSALLESIRKKRGHIVNIGTVGVWRPNLSCTGYAITKAALWKYTLSLAKEIEEVKVNMVSPGVLESSKEKPTSRIVPLSEVARTVAFLFESSCITGQNIEVAAAYGL